jgi:CO/xanthine dehydrogenase FAD-binding subunit
MVNRAIIALSANGGSIADVSVALLHAAPAAWRLFEMELA